MGSWTKPWNRQPSKALPAPTGRAGEAISQSAPTLLRAFLEYPEMASAAPLQGAITPPPPVIASRDGIPDKAVQPATIESSSGTNRKGWRSNLPIGTHFAAGVSRISGDGFGDATSRDHNSPLACHCEPRWDPGRSRGTGNHPKLFRHQPEGLAKQSPNRHPLCCRRFSNIRRWLRRRHFKGP